MKDVKLNFDDGEFVVTLDPKSKVKPSDVKKAVGNFDLDKIVATFSGKSYANKAGLRFDAASGLSMGLKNREKKKDDDKWEDVEAKVNKWLGENKTTVKVCGVLTEGKEGELTLTLDSAEYVEPRKDK